MAPSAGRTVKKAWWQFWASAEKKVDDNLDPNVALHQAVIDARQQTNEIRSGAADVLGSRNEISMQLNDAQQRLTELKKKVQQAVARKKQYETTDPEKAQRFHDMALSLAAQIQPLDHEVQSLTQLLEHAEQAADRAKQAGRDAELKESQVSAKATEIQGKLAQTRMLQALNKAEAATQGTGGNSGYSLGEVEARANSQYAHEAGVAELNASSTAGQMRELERELGMVDAEDYLAQLESDMELGSGSATPALGTGSEVIDTVTTDSTEPATSGRSFDPSTLRPPKS